MIRKWNAILSVVIVLLFILHGVAGSFQMLGVSDTVLHALAGILMLLAAAHMLIGIKLTVDSVKVWRKTGVSYFRENRLFWTRRFSGLAIMVLLIFHLTAFGGTTDGVYRLRWFDTAKLIAQLLLVLSLGVHIFSNVRPSLIALGIRPLKPQMGDIFFILSLLLLLMTAAFIIYYIRWNQI